VPPILSRRGGDTLKFDFITSIPTINAALAVIAIIGFGVTRSFWWLLMGIPIVGLKVLYNSMWRR
jgi:hypothetical protein